MSPGQTADKLETATYFDQDWDSDRRMSIQGWLDHAVGRRLTDTAYGVKTIEGVSCSPKPVVWEDPLVNRVIKLDIATFLIGEDHSIKTTAAMVRLAPDEKSRAFLATQVLDEARHFEAFCRRMAVLGVSPAEREELMHRYYIPEMRKLFDLTDELVDKSSFLGAVIAQNLILEGMAFPVYRYEWKYWSWFDPGLSQVIRGAFADEVAHTGYGQAYLRMMVAKDVRVRNDISKLMHQFYSLMREGFESHIKRYVAMYQDAANEHMSNLGDIVLFPNLRMADLTEEDQIRHLMNEIQVEYRTRAEAIGVDMP